MKTVAIIATLAACLAISYSAPVTQEVDWTAVATKVAELKDIISNAVEQIKTIANNDNSIVGSSIASKVDAAAITATSILNRASAAIAAQTLTEIEATDLLGELKGTMAKLKGTLTTDLALLTPEASAQIDAGFETTFDDVNRIGEEIAALLREPVPSTTSDTTDF